MNSFLMKMAVKKLAKKFGVPEDFQEIKFLISQEAIKFTIDGKVEDEGELSGNDFHAVQRMIPIKGFRSVEGTLTPTHGHGQTILWDARERKEYIQPFDFEI